MLVLQTFEIFANNMDRSQCEPQLDAGEAYLKHNRASESANILGQSFKPI